MAKHVGVSESAFLSSVLIGLLMAYIIFLRGFLPVKQQVTQFTITEDMPKEPTDVTPGENSIPLPDQFNRLVIMLIDALRADFIFSEKAPLTFTDSLMKRRRAAGFKAHAHPPTVTLPRIKALTTGSIPGFADVVLNYGSTALQDDNLLSQFLSVNKRLIFYGDDTWLRLFPKHFIRSDGTTSFFVTDFIEVDLNVTRHLDWELSQSDWDVMILHYLGLDHIGHLAGPKSPLIKPKLEEMDGVLKKIYQSLSTQPNRRTLVLLCGDHGMSDQGSHGGASISETTIPLLFMSSDRISKKAIDLQNLATVNQIDIVPTVALLFGLPIPANSYGIVISEVLQSWPVRSRVHAHLINSHQLLRLLEQNSANIVRESGYVLHQLALKAHTTWLQSRDNHTSNTLWERAGEGIIKQYREAMTHMNNELSSSITQYDMYASLTGILCLYMVFLSMLVYGMRQTNDVLCGQLSTLSFAVGGVVVAVAAFGHVTVCSGVYRSVVLCDYSVWSAICCVFVLMLLACSMMFLMTTCVLDAMINRIRVSLHGPLCVGYVLFGCTLLHTLSLLSSSFIEEEHQTWYFFTVTMQLLILVKFLEKLLLSWLKNSRGIVVDKAMYEAVRVKQTAEIEPTLLTEVIRDGINKSPPTMQYYQNVRTTLNHLKKIKPDKQRSEFSGGETVCKANEQSHQYNELLCTNQDICDDIDTQVVIADESTSVYVCSVLRVFGLLLVSRILRTWNQTGNKWLDRPDIGDWLIRPENKFFLSCAVVVSMTMMLVVRWRRHRHLVTSMMFLLGLVCVYCFRAASGNLLLFGFYQEISTLSLLEARIVYVVILIILLHAVWSVRSTTAKDMTPKQHTQTQLIYRPYVSTALQELSTALILLMSLLLRPHNVCFVAMVVVQEHLMLSLSVSMATWKLTLCYLWMGMATFFAQGNSNSISTVDISSGFIGLGSYSPVLIGLLLSLSTYGGVILWLLALITALVTKLELSLHKYSEPEKQFRHRLSVLVKEVVYTLTLSRLLPLAVFTSLTLAQRYHLFVWTVFSPKLLYEGTLSIIIVLFSLILLIALIAVR